MPPKQTKKAKMFTIDVSSNNPIIIVDEGYLLHYRYHATMRNFSFKAVPPTEDEVKEGFIKHLRQQLDKTKKKFKTTDMVFAIDARCSNVWRMEHFKEYKETRPECHTTISSVHKEFMKVLGEYGQLVSHKNLESDDIAAILCKHISSKNPSKKIYVITNDHDYLQLKKYPSVSLFKGSLTEITGSGNPYTDMMIKIVAGDPSDNIKGIAGKKKAQQLIIDGTLDEFIEKKKGAKEIIERNRLLVDFDMIPHTLQTDFLKTVVFK